MDYTKLRRIAAWIRVSPEDGMEDTEHRWAMLMKEPRSGSMVNAFVGWQHEREGRWETTWTLPRLIGRIKWRSRQAAACMIPSFVVLD